MTRKSKLDLCIVNRCASGQSNEIVPEHKFSRRRVGKSGKVRYSAERQGK